VIIHPSQPWTAEGDFLADRTLPEIIAEITAQYGRPASADEVIDAFPKVATHSEWTREAEHAIADLIREAFDSIAERVGTA
jgi:hypothetical protein